MRRLIWFGFLAVVLTLLAGGIWSALLNANLTTTPSIPWSVGLMALILWMAWRYFSGAGERKSTAETRRKLMRANVVSPRTFLWSMLAGISALVAFVGLWIILVALTKISRHSLPSFSAYPWPTTVAALVMASLVSSIAEEVGMRGYLQSMLEARTKPTLAILIPVLALAPGHLLTQGFLWPIFVFYLLADTTFGALAYLTNSILPGIIVHSMGLLIFFTLIWPSDANRRMMSTSDIWPYIVQSAISMAVSVFAFSRLAGTRRYEQAPATLCD